MLGSSTAGGARSSVSGMLPATAGEPAAAGAVIPCAPSVMWNATWWPAKREGLTHGQTHGRPTIRETRIIYRCIYPCMDTLICLSVHAHSRSHVAHCSIDHTTNHTTVAAYWMQEMLSHSCARAYLDSCGCVHGRHIIAQQV